MGTPEYNRLRGSVLTSLNPLVVIGNKVFSIFGHNISGTYTTGNYNGFVVWMSHAITYHAYYCILTKSIHHGKVFSDNNYLCIVGDDHIHATNDRDLDPIKFVRLLCDLWGFLITPADKTAEISSFPIELKNLDFISRSFKLVTFNGCTAVVAPLKFTSFFRMLHFYRDTQVPMEQVIESIAGSFLMESVLYGEAMYKELIRIYEPKFRKVGVITEFPSYEEALTTYMRLRLKAVPVDHVRSLTKLIK